MKNLYFFGIFCAYAFPTNYGCYTNSWTSCYTNSWANLCTIDFQ